MGNAYFKLEILHEIVNLLFDTGLMSAERIDALLVGMNADFQASLPAGASAKERTFKILGVLNTTQRLSTGEVPLHIFLYNVTKLFPPLLQTQRLQEILLELDTMAEQLAREQVRDELTKLIERSGIEIKTLRMLYRHCIREESARSLAVQNLPLRGLVHELWNMREGGRALPLLRFAYHVKKITSDPIYSELEKWMNLAREVRGLKINQSDMDALWQEETGYPLADQEAHKWTHLKVLVYSNSPEEEQLESHLSVTMYWWHKDKEPQQYGDRYWDVEFKRLPEIIQTALDVNLPEVVEVFLPAALMNADIEFAEDEQGIFIAEDPLVLRRFAERQEVFYEGSRAAKTRAIMRAKDEWEKKWAQFSASTRQMSEHHRWIREQDLDNPTDLQRDMKLSDLIFSTSPAFAPGRQLGQLLRSALNAGLPIVFWSRDVPGNIEALVKQQVLCSVPDSYLATLRARQKEGLINKDEEQRWKRLYLLWDDPHQPFPIYK